jgi:hypothetical protein
MLRDAAIDVQKRPHMDFHAIQAITAKMIRKPVSSIYAMVFQSCNKKAGRWAPRFI